MQTRIAGIPCIVNLVSVVGQFSPAVISKDPDYCHEAEYPEVTFQVCDRKGYPAPWLERKLTCEEASRIESELLEELGND